MNALLAAKADWQDWAVLAVVLAAWLVVARHMIHRLRWENRKSAQYVERAIRKREDIAWELDRLDALRLCMRTTIRRAQWQKLAELGFAVDETEAVI
jgi:hypothetical protein